MNRKSGIDYMNFTFDCLSLLIKIFIFITFYYTIQYLNLIINLIYNKIAMKMFISSLLINLFIHIVDSQVTLLQFTSSTNYSLDTSNYTLNFDFSLLKNQANITISIQLPTQIVLIVCIEPCISNYNSFNFTYTSSQSNFSFLARNPYLNGTYTINIKIFQLNSILTLNTNTINITILPQPINVAISSSNNNVGSLANFTISILPKTQIYNGSQLFLIFPQWIPTNLNGYFQNYSCIANNSITIGCNFSITNSKIVLSIPSLFSINTTGNTFLQLRNFKNPSSTYPYTIQGAFLYNNITFSTFNLILTVQIPANTNLLIPSLQSQVSSMSTTNFSIYINLFFPPGGFINITYDSTLSLSFSNFAGYTTTTNSNSLRIGGINNGNNSLTGMLNLNSFSIINPIIAKTIYINVTTQFILNGTLYLIERGSFIITLIPNTFTNIKVIQNQTQTYSKNSMNFNINISTQLNGNNNGNNAYLILGFPIQYGLTASSCFNLSNNSTCNIVISNSNLQILTGNLQSGTLLNFRIDGIINPRYTSSYNISIGSYTYFYDNFYLIQYYMSNLIVSVSKLNIISSSNSSIVGQSVLYTVILGAKILNNEIIRFFQSNSTIIQLQNSSTFNWNNQYSAWQYKMTNDSDNFTFQFRANNPNTLTNSCMLSPITIYNSSNIIYATNSTPSCPNVTLLGKIYPIIQSKNTSLSGILSQSNITLTFNVLYSTGDILKITFPTSYNLTNFRVIGLYGVNNNLYFTLNGNSVSIVLVFDIFYQNSIKLQLICNNSYVSGNFPINFSTYDKNLFGKQTAIIYQTISTNKGYLNYSPIRLNTNQTINFSLSLPFFINSVNLQFFFSSNPTYYNYLIDSCVSLQNLNCSYSPLNKHFKIMNITNSVVNFSISFTFFYFDTFEATFSTYYNSLLSTQIILNLTSFCGWHCQNCSSTASTSCYTCFSSIYTNYILYSTKNMLCYQNCPMATYQNGNYCQDCSLGCSSCISKSTCSKCNQGYQLINSNCNSLCGIGQYYLSGKCQNCPFNCKTCNSTMCMNCLDGAIFINNSCVFINCTNNCLTCSISQSNCTSCNVGYFYNYNCYDNCPFGTVLDLTNKICLPKPNNKIAIFPYLIFSVVMFITIIGSKLVEPKTDVFALMVSILGVSQMLCILSLIGSISSKNTPLIIGIISVIIYVIMNLIYFYYYMKFLRNDQYYIKWIQQKKKNKISLFVVLFLSILISFKVFRIIYSKFLSRVYFSAKFQNNQIVFYFANILTGIHFLCFSILELLCAGITLNSSMLGSQSFYFSIEAIIICCLSNIFCLLDIKKQPKYFQDIQNNQINNTQNEQRSKNSLGALMNTLQNIQQSSEMSQQNNFSKKQLEHDIDQVNNNDNNKQIKLNQIENSQNINQNNVRNQQEGLSKIKLTKVHIEQIEIKQKNNEVKHQENIQSQHIQFEASSIIVNNMNNNNGENINIINNKIVSQIQLYQPIYQNQKDVEEHNNQFQSKIKQYQNIQQIKNQNILLTENNIVQQNFSKIDRQQLINKNSRIIASPIQDLHKSIGQQSIKLPENINDNYQSKQISNINNIQSSVGSQVKKKSIQKDVKQKNEQSILNQKKQGISIPKLPKKRANNNKIKVKKQTKCDDLFLGFLNQQEQDRNSKQKTSQIQVSDSSIQKNSNSQVYLGRGESINRYNQQLSIEKEKSEFTSNQLVEEMSIRPQSEIKLKSMTQKSKFKKNVGKQQQIKLAQGEHKPSVYSKTFSNGLYKSEKIG